MSLSHRYRGVCGVFQGLVSRLGVHNTGTPLDERLFGMFPYNTIRARHVYTCCYRNEERRGHNTTERVSYEIVSPSELVTPIRAASPLAGLVWVVKCDSVALVVRYQYSHGFCGVQNGIESVFGVQESCGVQC